MLFVAATSSSRLRTCLLVTLMLSNITATSQHNNNNHTQTYMQELANKRYDVAPRDVKTCRTAMECAVKCHVASWCVSANVFIGDGGTTCQLLSEVTSDETSLEAASGWQYLRKCKKKRFNYYSNAFPKRNFFSNIFAIYVVS